MKILILDTSTEKSQVIFAQSIEDFTVQHGRPLVSEIQKFGEPDAIAVTTGPGSFTGIRVGMALALGMAFSKDLPLINLSSLSGFISEVQGRFLSLIDARGGGAYIMVQERCGDQIQEITRHQRCSLEELPRHLIGCKKVVGPDLKRFDLLNCEERYADPSHLVKLAYSQLASELKPFWG